MVEHRFSVSRKALAALCQLIGLTLSQATHAQGNSAAALTNDGNYIARLSWERELVSGLDAQRLLLSIESTGQGTALEWQQLQVAAERRVHIMVMGADTDKFMHVHLEDFSLLPGNSALHTDAPQAGDTEFTLFLTFPAAGRYIAGIEFVPASGPSAGQEVVAHVIFLVPGTPVMQRPPQSPPSYALSAVRPVAWGPGLEYVAPVSLSSIRLPLLVVAGSPDQTGYVARLEVIDSQTALKSIAISSSRVADSGPPSSTRAGNASGSSNGSKGSKSGLDGSTSGGSSNDGDGGSIPLLPTLTAGTCYLFRIKLSHYADESPVTDMSRLLSHTMHLAAVPTRSLASVDHFHAMVSTSLGSSMPGMGSEGSSTPCDAGDDAMPEAPATFTGDLAAWYRFDRAAHYILVAQAAAKNGSEMVLPSWHLVVQPAAGQEVENPWSISASLYSSASYPAAHMSAQSCGLLVAAVLLSLSLLLRQ